MNEKYMIALDVGGTKTDAVLFSQSGRIVKRISAAGGIPFDHGVKTTIDNCIRAIDSLLDKTGIKPCALYAAIATVEYYHSEFISAFRERTDIERIRIEGDGCCLISAMLGHSDGACMICGTGSALYMRKGDEYRHIGGGGQLIDSCGSGFALGRYALQSCLRACDGSTHPTLLCELIEKQAGGRPWEDLPTVYSVGRSYIASFARAVFEARRLGDTTARRIFNTCASDIADVIWAARKEIGHGFDIVFNGGIFSNFPEYADAVRALAPSDINVIYSNVPPVYGCAVEAMYDMGIGCDAHFKEEFMRGYAK